jgi:hypothetical protein
MIFGQNRLVEIIGAKNLQGYDPYLTDDFTKAFIGGEKVVVYYPPDHSLSASTYHFNSDSGTTNSLGVFYSEEDRNVSNAEDSLLKFRKDFVLPYQTNLTIQMGSSVSSPLPLSDSATGGSGFDAFFIKGSVVVGESSGAKRYYSGPFKGWSKELECVCEGTTAVNQLDGSDCRGWLKGSLYEKNYIYSYHDVFNYIGEPKQIADHKNPFNDGFMTGTPFETLNYSWSNVLDRTNRPIPYNMLVDGKGNYAVLIGRKHAIVHKDADIDTTNLRFYSNEYGMTSVNVVAQISDFRSLWDQTGFASPNVNENTMMAFQGMSAHWQGVKLLKFETNLPEDINQIVLYDPYGSDMIYYGLAFGQDGRGSVGVFCPPLTGDITGSNQLTNNKSGKSRLSFTKDNKCGSFPYPLVVGGDCCGCKTPRTIMSLMLDGVSEDQSVGAVLEGDIGSPVITYYNDTPVFLGFIDSVGYREHAYADLIGVGIGSKKKYPVSWGTELSIFDVLQLYFTLTGNDSFLNATAFNRNTTPDAKYPFPIGFPKT